MSSRPSLLQDLRTLTPGERAMWRFPMMWLGVLIITLVPVLYATLYLGSVWDPYGQLKNLPVALVNQDAGTVSQGKQVNLGTQLVSQLRRDPPAKLISYPSQAAAENAVRRGEVYFALSIPATFSARALAADSGQHGLLELYSAPGTSYFASRVGSSVAARLADGLNDSLGGHRWTVVQRALAQSRGQLAQLRQATGQLRDGAARLKNGTGTLASGAASLATGTEQATAGAAQLQAGAQRLAGGVDRLTTGSSTLSAALKQLDAAAPGQAQLRPLQAGAAQLSSGASTLAAGLTQLSGGARRLADATSTLSDGANRLNAGAERLSVSARQLSGQLPQLEVGLQKATSGASELGAGLAQQVQGSRNLAGAVAANPTAPAELSAGSAQLATGAAALQQGGVKLLSSLESLYLGARTATDGARQFTSGAVLLATGADSLAGGAAQLKRGAASLADRAAQGQSGASQLNTGARSLASGVNTLVSGNLKLKAALDSITNKLPAQANLNALSQGAGSLTSGSARLTSSLAKLQAGAQQLSGGAASAQAGAARLYSGLSRLYATIPTSTPNLDGDPAGLAASVQVQERHAGQNVSNGAAFAPYFMALSLWVGVTLTTFVFPYLQIAHSGRATSQLARLLRKVAVPALVVALQAVIVVVGVHLLGVPYQHPWAVLLTALLSGLTFLLVVMALILLLGDAGRILSLILLVLQLAASGGSYPVELAPRFFGVIHAVIPVTDTVNALRAALFGSYDGQYAPYLLRLLVVALTAALLALLGRRWRYVPDTAFKPLLYVDRA